MKKIIFYLILASFVNGACKALPFLPGESTSPQSGSSSESSADNKSLSELDDKLEIFFDGLVDPEQLTMESLSGASFYSIEFTIQDEIFLLDGVEQVIYTNRENIPLEEIHFRLLPNVLGGGMTVASVQVEGQPVESTYALRDSLMRVPLISPLQPGDSTDIEIEFSVVVPTSIESNYGILAYYEGVLTLAHTYPMIAVYDDEGWNAEIPPNQGDPTYADASFFLVTVDAPVNLVLVSAGHEIQREETGNRQIATFAAGPVRDYYLAASADYQLTSQTIDGVTYNSYAFEGMEEGAQFAIEVSAEAFDYFGDLYAPYPYTEYDIVATPTFALGIEYPGIIAITDRIYDLNSTSFGTPNSIMLESTTAHEAGHQWFYNLVGSDQLDEPWMDESLTQFATWEYYGDKYGSSGAAGYEGSMQARWSGVDYAAIPIGQPVAAYEGTEYSAIIYGRGAFFFEALRDEIGDEDFNSLMRDYVQKNSWGIGTGDEFMELAEIQCECDLSSLYAEWVMP